MIVTPTLSGYWRGESIGGSAPAGYARAGEFASLSNNDPISIVAWVRLQQYTTYGGLVHIGQTGLHVGFDDDNGRITFHHPGVVEVHSAEAIPLNELAMVAVTHDGQEMNEDHTKLYINGAPATASTAGGGGPDYTGVVLIGRQSSWDDQYLFPDLLRHVAVFNRILTPSEIASLYNGGSPVDFTTVINPADFISYWKCDEMTGNTLHDSMGDNHALIIGRHTWIDNGVRFLPAIVGAGVPDSSGNLVSAVPVADADLAENGKFGKCMAVPGPPSYFRLAASSRYNPQNGFTVTFWTRFTANQYGPMGMLSVGGNGIIMIGANLPGIPGKPNEPDLCVNWYSTDGFNPSYAYLRTTDLINDGQWHFIAAAIAPEPLFVFGRAELYVDMILKDYKLEWPPAGAFILPDVPLIAAADTSPLGGIHYFEGQIDEVMFFQKRLTEVQLRRVMLGLHPF